MNLEEIMTNKGKNNTIKVDAFDADVSYLEMGWYLRLNNAIGNFEQVFVTVGPGEQLIMCSCPFDPVDGGDWQLVSEMAVGSFLVGPFRYKLNLKRMPEE